MLLSIVLVRHLNVLLWHLSSICHLVLWILVELHTLWSLHTIAKYWNRLPRIWMHSWHWLDRLHWLHWWHINRNWMRHWIILALWHLILILHLLWNILLISDLDVNFLCFLLRLRLFSLVTTLTAALGVFWLSFFILGVLLFFLLFSVFIAFIFNFLRNIFSFRLLFLLRFAIFFLLFLLWLLFFVFLCVVYGNINFIGFWLLLPLFCLWLLLFLLRDRWFVFYLNVLGIIQVDSNSFIALLFLIKFIAWVRILLPWLIGTIDYGVFRALEVEVIFFQCLVAIIVW